MLFATYVFLTKNLTNITDLVQRLQDSSIKLSIYFDIEGISNNISFYPEIIKEYIPALVIIQSENPVNLDNYIRGIDIQITSPPWDFKVSEKDANCYFYSNPGLFLLSEYESDYSSYNLNFDLFKELYPELSAHLETVLRLKF